MRQLPVADLLALGLDPYDPAGTNVLISAGNALSNSFGVGCGSTGRSPGSEPRWCANCSS
jgi:hypothetical protein